MLKHLSPSNTVVLKVWPIRGKLFKTLLAFYNVLGFVLMVQKQWVGKTTGTLAQVKSVAPTIPVVIFFFTAIHSVKLSVSLIVLGEAVKIISVISYPLSTHIFLIAYMAKLVVCLKHFCILKYRGCLEKHLCI